MCHLSPAHTSKDGRCSSVCGIANLIQDLNDCIVERHNIILQHAHGARKIIEEVSHPWSVTLRQPFNHFLVEKIGLAFSGARSELLFKRSQCTCKGFPLVDS